jgi:hypothetical protein
MQKKTDMKRTAINEQKQPAKSAAYRALQNAKMRDAALLP